LKKILFTLLVAGFCGGLQAQPFTGDSLYFLRPADTMMVYNDVSSGQILFDHYIAPGQTLYGVTKFYGLTLEDVYHLNPGLRAKYETGNKVRVAIPRGMIRAVPAPDSLAWFVPVYYRMGRGETLFGLYKRILQLPNDEQLRALNPALDPNRMSANQELAIGYMKLDGVPKELQGEIEDAYVRRNRGLRDLWRLRTEGKKMISNNGKAAWTSKGDPGKWMALHRTAPINSLIEIEDPRSRKTIYARVVGRIPGQVNDPNVIVVVSPLLVKAFGVRDTHFYVRTRHF
jgi:LysM repeat protein